MQARVGMWGGSHALRLPKMAVETLGLNEGADVDIEIENGSLVVRPSRPRYHLDDLVQQARSARVPEAFDQEPIGNETL